MADENQKTTEQNEKVLCNETKTAPGDNLAANVAFVSEFKRTNLSPTSGYNQHINALGLTTFSCLDRLSNETIQRIALAAQEKLAQRASLRGTEHGLPKEQSPEDAAKRLKATAEFANKRVPMIASEAIREADQRAIERSKRLGIVLNLPGVEKESSPKETVGAA